MAQRKNNLYLAVDVGGTKIQASLVEHRGMVKDSHRLATPRDAKAEQVVDAIIQCMQELLEELEMDRADLSGIGIAVPGVIDPEAGIVVFSPNVALTGVPLIERVKQAFECPVAFGNDTNLGTL